jgi:hypothetical protein
VRHPTVVDRCPILQRAPPRRPLGPLGPRPRTPGASSPPAWASPSSGGFRVLARAAKAAPIPIARPGPSVRAARWPNPALSPAPGRLMACGAGSLPLSAAGGDVAGRPPELVLPPGLGLVPAHRRGPPPLSALVGARSLRPLRPAGARSLRSLRRAGWLALLVSSARPPPRLRPLGPSRPLRSVPGVRGPCSRPRFPRARCPRFCARAWPLPRSSPSLPGSCCGRWQTRTAGLSRVKAAL